MLLETGIIFSKEKPLILASKSPQRSRILEMMGIPFQAVESGFDEIAQENMTPIEMAEAFARGKAQAIFEKFPDSIVVGVDTLVISATGEILGKPLHREDARTMLLKKSGQKETVVSGICLLSPGKMLIRHESADIHFSTFSEEDVERMLTMDEWQEKSGGISVEGNSSIYIQKIDGNFWNIVGFPIPTFWEMLKELN